MLKPSPYDFDSLKDFRAAYNARTWSEETEMLALWEARRTIEVRNGDNQLKFGSKLPSEAF